MIKQISINTKFGWVSAYETNGKIFKIKFGKLKKQIKSEILKKFKKNLINFFNKKKNTIKSPHSIKGNYIQKKEWLELTTLSRLPPNYPYHLVSYFWGITDVNILIFIIGSIIGILPGLSLETYIGYKFSDIKNIFKSNHSIIISTICIIVTIIITLWIGYKAEKILNKDINEDINKN